MLQNVNKQAHVLPAAQKSPTDAAKLYMQRRKEITCINGSLPPHEQFTYQVSSSYIE